MTKYVKLEQMDHIKLLIEELEPMEMYISWIKFKEKSVMWDRPMKIGLRKNWEWSPYNEEKIIYNNKGDRGIYHKKRWKLMTREAGIS